MDFTGTKIDNRLVLENKTAYELYIDKAKPGQQFKIAITKVGTKKTPSQMGYYMVTIISAAQDVFTKLGWTTQIGQMIVPISREDTDRAIKYFCGRVDENGDIVMHNPDSAVLPVMLKGDSDKMQMSQLISNAKFWLESQFDYKLD